jgi:hypothetical protein
MPLLSGPGSAGWRAGIPAPDELGQPPGGQAKLAEQSRPCPQGENGRGGGHRRESNHANAAASPMTGNPKMTSVAAGCRWNSPGRKVRVAITAISSSGMTVTAEA